MRLSDEKARRLTLLVWRERLRNLLPLAAGAGAFAGVLATIFVCQFGHVDGTIAVHDLNGTVLALESGGNGRPVSVLRVQLDDGREVDASAAFRILPHNGAQIVVAEERHASGHLTYRLQRVLDH